MADGFTITAQGVTEAQRELMERAQRLLDLSPALRVVAAEIEKQTDDAFRDSKSPAGEVFPGLAPSTIRARAAKMPGANRRSKKTGKLTKGARQKRLASRANIFAISKNFKPLVDTSRARNSQHATIVGKNSIEWSAVGYLQPHVTGSQKRPGRPPKRNVSVFELRGGELRPNPRINSLLLESVTRYVQTGRV